ncbi:hypothetical protein [Thalassotalea euphylliae]|uniref:Sel1 repeat family protein n=1 Tax=Thalassotalea euphylliae TaxID=1655234 RepID=A0A3E0U2D0_9GAMM|nr:hypothetical protein [Thalassotalea euphylliae]REL31096.1 hypothetical protein DXX94_10450 [Thalassotalea euphylliae]
MRWAATAFFIFVAVAIVVNSLLECSEDKQHIVSTGDKGDTTLIALEHKFSDSTDVCFHDSNEQSCPESSNVLNAEINGQPIEELTGIDRQPTSSWKLSTPLHTQLAQLEYLSANGNLQAAFILAKNLRYCFYTPSDEESYQDRVNKALDNNEDDHYLAKIAENYEYCQGVMHATKKQFAHYLAFAANQGHLDAMLDYGFANTELLVKVESETRSALTARTEVLAAQQEYLTTAALQGNVKAIARLSDNLWQQKFGNNDGSQALAYLYLLLELTDDSQLYSRYQWQEQRMSKQLSPEKVAQARDLSQDLVRNIISNIQSELKTR